MISVGRSGGGLEDLEGSRQHFLIVGVAHAHDVPAIGDEARCHVVAEGQCGIALNGDVVVVVDPAQIRELQVTGQRGRFAAHALHHAAVASQRIYVVVEHVESRPVEILRHPLGRRWPSRRWWQRLGPSGPVVVSMPDVQRYSGWPGHLLSSCRKFLMSSSVTLTSPSVSYSRVDGLHLGQVQQRIQQHRRVAHRQHEAVAIGPDWIVRIEPQELLPQAIGHRRHRHGRSWMAGVGLLDGIHGQSSDGVDRELIDIRLIAGWDWADVDITTYHAPFSAPWNSGIVGIPREYDTELSLAPIFTSSGC